MRRFLAVGAAVAVATLLLASAAVAAPPANDDRSDATLVGSIPYADTTETFDATPQGNDPDCGGGSSVWYAFTPSESGRYVATTRGSDYDTMLWVGTNGGGLTTLDCNDDHFGVQSLVRWDALAGVDYLLMVSVCCGDDSARGGHLELEIDVAPPLPKLTLTIADTARLTSGSKVRVGGDLTCRRAPDGIVIEVRVRQDAGRLKVRGQRVAVVPCSSDRWGAKVGDPDFRFGTGRADVVVRASACNLAGCREKRDARTVRVR